MILKAFWQHKIDIKDFLRVEMSQIEGEILLIFGYQYSLQNYTKFATKINKKSVNL